MTSMTNLQGTNPVSSNMTNPSTPTTCQQQAAPNQHDIIRILAQHFNQQSHQSDVLTPRIGGNHSTSAATNANNIDLLHQTVAHVQQQQHSATGQNALNLPLMNGRVNLAAAAAAACLMGTNLNDRTFLASQEATLASVPITTNNPTTTSASPVGHLLGPTRADPLSTHSGGKLINDMNLISPFNCFNMNSDQLMLSLQQQYLIQMASAANRHYETKQNNLNPISLSLDAAHQFHQQQQQQQHHHFNQLVQHHAELFQQQHQQQQCQKDLQTNQRSRRHLTDQAISKKVADLIETQGDEGRELLKFSISAILGQGSPVAGGQERAGLHSPNEEINAISNQKSADITSGRLRQTQASSPECDANVLTDLSSDSSTINTPLPQSSSKSAAALDQCQSREGPAADLSARASSIVDQVARYHQASTEQQRSAPANQQHPSTLAFLTGSAPFPWTSTARGKPRRGMMRRAVFSDSQRVGLEKRFQLQKYISKPDRKKLAERLGLRDSQVKIWFQNRRMKWRNSKERELLSAGGSREQTLPTRNNPNPDLSDVGETVKKLTSSLNNHTAT